MRRLTLLIVSAALVSGACGQASDGPGGGTRTSHHVGSAGCRDAADDRRGPDHSPADGYDHRRGLSDDRRHAFGRQRPHCRPVDFNGDGTPDTLRVYRLGTAWHVRGEMGGTGFHDIVVAHSGPRMAALAGARIDADLTEEAWVNVGSGAYTDHVSFYAYRSRRLLAAVDGTEAAVFAVGASVRHADGLTCTGGGTGFEVSASSTNDRGLLEASSTTFALEVHESAAVVVRGPTTPRSTAFSGFACGRLTRSRLQDREGKSWHNCCPAVYGSETEAQRERFMLDSCLGGERRCRADGGSW